MARIGLISDTHVPYRAPRIPPRVVEALRECDLILHAGDVDEPAALAPLRALAPVYAVRGNYHFLDRSDGGASFPETVGLEVEGFRLVVRHGHDAVPFPLLWRGWTTVRNLLGVWDFALQDAIIARSLTRRYPQADVIVFGHTHRFHAAWWAGTLLVNPGAALRTSYFGAPLVPSLAYLTLERGRAPRVRRVALPDGFQ